MDLQNHCLQILSEIIDLQIHNRVFFSIYLNHRSSANWSRIDALCYKYFCEFMLSFPSNGGPSSWVVNELATLEEIMKYPFHEDSWWEQDNTPTVIRAKESGAFSVCEQNWMETFGILYVIKIPRYWCMFWSRGCLSSSMHIVGYIFIGVEDHAMNLIVNLSE